MVIDNNFYMSQALNEAWQYQVATFPNPAVGAVVVSACGKIVAIEAHHQAGMPHAEVLALQKAYALLTNDSTILALKDSAAIHKFLLENHNGCFVGCSIYSTLEPCSHEGRTPSCANLLAGLGISEVYIGVCDTNNVASGGGLVLKDAAIRVEYGLLEQKCKDLLVPFYAYLKKKQFVFFKVASRLDGGVDGGTVSSESSRKFVHILRDVCDLLVVGGNTVRIDRPTLDARLCGGKAPDVLIYSKKKEFDTTIPLFNVTQRTVQVDNTFDLIKNYRCIMIEGGGNMLEQVRDIVDCLLVFIAPSMKKHTSGLKGIDANFKLLHTHRVEDDVVAWYAKKS